MAKQIKVTLFILVLCLMIFEIRTIARAPIPYCSSKVMYKQIALAAQQFVSVDMSDFFSGYNLHITLGSNNSFADVHRKQYVMDEKKQYFPNIISHFIEPKGNSVGRDSFLLFQSPTGATWLNYGIIRDKSRLPQTSSTVMITSDKNVECFDAAMFLDHGLAVVDCVKKGQRLFATYQNIFYIVDFTDHSIKKMVQNDLFIGFTSITRRKLMKFSHPQAGGFTYLLRTYFSDGVDAAHSDNTYMEIFIVPVQDPTEIQLLRVIDRTFLNQKALRIMDAEIYLDDIFLLDYDTGLYRLDIMKSQRVAVTGRYRDFGFEKFAVYSDDLQDQLIIALSNKHSIYEIDWKKVSKPVLINKYSIMENSKVKRVFLNDRFLVVQSSAMAFNKTNPEFQIDNTWIFSRGSRTYLNAYHVIHHNSSIVEVDFDRSQSNLYIADEQGLTLRSIDDAKLVMHYTDQSRYGNSQDIVVFADSFDRFSNQSFRCQQKITIQFMNPENTTILSTGIELTNTYSINYPRLLDIPLQNYYRGPDIKYKLTNTNESQLPINWINKVNLTTIKINPEPNYQITFFHCHVQNALGFQKIRYYYQDSLNNTHFAQCTHEWTKSTMNCQVVNTFNHSSKIRSLATSSFVDDDAYNYFYSIVFNGNSNSVFIYSYSNKKLIAQITYQANFEGQISNIASSNGFLYVTRSLAKTIDVYSLAKCAQYSVCKPDFSITKDTLKAFKIYYFSPKKVVTDDQHPQVLFIKCEGSLLILDIDNKQNIVLLDEIISLPTYDSNYQIAISKTRLVISAFPNLLFEYSLQHLYIYNLVTLTKTLPIYGYKIQPNADIQFSDYDSTVYVNAYDPVKSVSVILIYRTGRAASNSLYATIVLDKLYSRPGFQVEVGGYDVNFLSIVTGKKITVYRVFTKPFLTIKQNIQNFNFTLEASNDKSKLTSDTITVQVVNLKQKITPTQIFNNSNELLTVANKGDFIWQDREWFDGSVVHLNYTCLDCNKGQDSKVKLRQHIDQVIDLHVGGNHYTESYQGGLSVWNDIFRFRSNGTVYQIVGLPDQRNLQKCVKIAAAEFEIFAVTACRELGRGINLYVTSFVGFKPFTWGPYFSEAYEVRKLQIINDILMVVDTPQNPSYLSKNGQIYLYRLSFNGESQNQMDQLQVIDSNDFVGCPGWNEDKAFLGNAHFHYSTQTNSYRLYITQAKFGLFVVDFVKPHGSDNEITILATSFIDIRKLVQDNKLHMPTDSTFVAVHFVKSVYNPVLDMQNVIVTTKGYDNLQISLIYDKAGFVSTSILHRVYKRYGYYETLNDVHAKRGFIVVGYTLPPEITDQDATKQYIALYDSNDYPHQSQKGYSVHSIIGAIPIDTKTAAGYSINTTYDRHSNGTRTGIVISMQQDHRLFGASISHNLTLSLSKGYKNQDIQINAYNDFSSFKFNATLIAEPQEETSTTIIIIIIILSGIVFLFLIFYIGSVMNKKRPLQQRQSLLTQNQTLARQSVAQPVQAYIPPSIEEKSQENIIIKEQEKAAIVKSVHIQEQNQIKEEQEIEQKKDLLIIASADIKQKNESSTVIEPEAQKIEVQQNIQDIQKQEAVVVKEQGANKDQN